MGCAEVISLAEVRARKQWDGLRQALHARFDQWLDAVEARLPEHQMSLSEVSDLVWQLRQELTGGFTETLLKITPCGRAIPLDRHTPWSHRCILDTQA